MTLSSYNSSSVPALQELKKIILWKDQAIFKFFSFGTIRRRLDVSIILQVLPLCTVDNGDAEKNRAALFRGHSSLFVCRSITSVRAYEEWLI